MKLSSFTNSVFCTILILIVAGSCKKDKQEPTDISSQYTVTTVAGDGKEGHADRPAASSQFDHPRNLVIDAQGTIYVSDVTKHCIRKITKDGMVSTLAGGTRGTTDGSGTNAQFISPGALAVDAQDNIYVVDSIRIRKVTPTGNVTTVAGTSAPFDYLTGIAVDKQGNIYAVNHIIINSEIRKITPSGVVSTFIDTTEKFATGGFLSSMQDVVIDANGNLYVTRNVFLGYELYKITPSKKVTLIASIPDPGGITVHPYTGELFFTGSPIQCGSISSCRYLYRVYKLTSGGKYVVVAGYDEGYADGPGNTARFYAAAGISADAQGNLYVADVGNNRIRKISKI